MSPRRRLPLVLAAALSARAAFPADYCIDAAAGNDTNSGLCPSSPWRSFQPTICRAFSPGDRVLVAAGTYDYPQTGWYMTPGVSWIGAGADLTIVTVRFNPPTPVPFVRFRQGSGGCGPVCRTVACPFGATTVISDMTFRNQGNAEAAVEIVATSGTASPRIERLRLEGFASGIVLHPSDDDRVAATVSATIAEDVIVGASDAAIESFADNFYGKAVTESSTITNVAAASSGTGVRIKTLVNNLRDRAFAVARPALVNDTIAAGSQSAAFLVSYYDDGTGARRVTSDAGVVTPALRNGIFTGSARFGIEEYSAFTEPAEVTSNALGGNALGDYRDEGTTTLTAPAVGTGNLSATALFVDAAAGDLHVLSGSPTIDRIPAASAPAIDADGHARPQGAQADMGADEWVACSARADASASVDPPPCTGQPGRLDGTRSTVDPVCAAGLAFAWYEGTTTVATTPAVDVSPSVATSYRLRVTCADRRLSACFGETTRLLAAVTTAPAAGAGPDAATCEVPGSTVAFALTGSGTAVPPATIAAWAWTATAGTLSSPSSPSTNLTLPAGFTGAVTVTLTVTDSTGCQASDGAVLTVRAAPSVSAGPDRQTCARTGATVRFNLAGTASASAPATLVSTTWTATQGTIGNPASPSTTLDATAATTTALITATLEAIDSSGCSRRDSAEMRLAPEPTASPGGPYSVMQSGGATTDIQLDGTASTGEGTLAYAWRSDLGTFADTGTATSSLARPVLRIVNNNQRQVANVCLTVTAANGCPSPESCVTAVVRIVAAQAPNDVGNSLRARKSAPASIALFWQDAAADALHDEALSYEVWGADAGCGPFSLVATVPRQPGTNAATVPGLAPPPALRLWRIVATNDGGASLPAPPDGTQCR